MKVVEKIQHGSWQGVVQAQDSGTDVSVLLLGQLSELQHQLENRAVHEME